ncbi:MAG: squalene-hopene/tetraprenyl-beta-curcumene cyclase [Gammaproteobacteria bacterium]|jgi:squalene-hopene/tetraprenyl-beta-curcumene cyclase
MNKRQEPSIQVLIDEEIEDIVEVLSQRTVHPLEPATDPAQLAMNRAAKALSNRQADDGHWLFELEADATIPSEYLLLHYFMRTVDREREQKIAKYLRRRQHNNGSWSLYEGGPGDISATVKAYFALKLAGDLPDDEHMARTRNWVRANGGAEAVNVFTRITLAVFGQLPWRAVPAMPVEIMYLPSWWFFNLSKVSYWSRCVIVPLLIIFAKRPVVELTEEQGVAELFLNDPCELRHMDRFKPGKPLQNAFLLFDRFLKVVDRFTPNWVRQPALRRAENWMRDHSKGKGGLGAIYPAMANAAVALRALGAPENDPDFVRTMQAIEDFVVDKQQETYCQPCVSPIWDTCLSLTALTEAGAHPDHPAVQQAVDWLLDQQIFVEGDWSSQAKKLAPGGWAFQFENDKYPDVDDTGMVLMSLIRAGVHDRENKVKRINQAVNWVLGMQNKDGSWGAFDIGNDHEYLNNIPFADHGALVDPGTADLTARCVELLAMLGYDQNFPPLHKALQFLENDQEEFGAWYGRWGVNYIYGTWSVLSAVGVIGEDVAKPYIRKAIAWLKDIQNVDGGWGESCNSYDDPILRGQGETTASQTAWALLGLMAVGEVDSIEVERGIEYLVRTQNDAGEWDEEAYTGTGFPRVFYLRYHGYSRYFPLWALASYARLRRGLPTRQSEIMEQGWIELGPIPVLASA